MQKVLITGATGYIGSYTSRIMAATQPHVTVYALSRQSPAACVEKHPQMAHFRNIEFVQGDCLEADKLPADLLADCDCVIHMVGAITDAFNYKKLLSRITFKDDAKGVQECLVGKMREMQEMNPMKVVSGL